MSSEKLLENKSIVITGAGRGIGRAIALLAASHGARVLVNDLGAEADGSGDDPSPAATVAQDIRDQGGEAVSSVDSVSSWEGAHAIVEKALDSFGTIDCVVNNAGNLRDQIFHKMTEEDFDKQFDI